MKKFLKWTMLVYNLMALSFLPLFLMAFLPEMSIISNIAWHLNNWLFMALVLLIIPFQQYFIPQILALVLIGLYINENQGKNLGDKILLKGNDQEDKSHE